ncbi:hypothetical protein K438DRAFT_1778447 [Mycena galopus ATCC 62051]|nr:hypothetical protein K438DRAFT_1778447 [Mycena galopus ATCC 62051]
MDDAPWAFDLADLAPAVLLFGHMGPALADNWTDLYRDEASQATTSEMRKRFQRLPHTLTDIQRLSLKPQVDLTEEEIKLTEANEPHISHTNPVLRYLQEKAKSKLPQFFKGKLPVPNSDFETDMDMDMDIVYPDVDPDVVDPDDLAYNLFEGELSDIEASENSENSGEEELRSMCSTPKKYFTWTALKPPYITKAPNPAHSPPDALVFTVITDEVRKRHTLKAVKRSSKLYTVGPLDFCGHAKAIRRGAGWVIALCNWDSTLPKNDQGFMQSTWDSIGKYPKGMRKYSKATMIKEKAFKAKLEKLMTDGDEKRAQQSLTRHRQKSKSTSTVAPSVFESRAGAGRSREHKEGIQRRGPRGPYKPRTKLTKSRVKSRSRVEGSAIQEAILEVMDDFDM